MASTVLYDVGLDADGDLPVATQHISGFDLVTQRISRALRIVKGEYFLNKSVGLLYFDWFQQKPPQTAAIGAVIRATVEAVPGVTRVEDFVSGFDPATRALSFSMTIYTTDGDASIVVLPFGTPRSGNRNPSLNMLLLRIARIHP